MTSIPTSFAEWQTYPLHHPAKVLSVEEIPKLGSGKADYGQTKKIALANPN